jgi:ABC-2 type transport system ATP-binding protein
MKMILGLYPADAGTIQVNGEKVTYGQTKTNRNIGYLPDVPEFYGYMTPTEYLRLCGEITGITEKHMKSRIPELLQLVGLDKSNKRIQGFSRGMKQRLGIAQALLNQPKLLICDEPTSALDPIGRKEIIDILQSVKNQTTVIFSTHILSDVERICDHIALLHNGKLALTGKLDEIRKLRRRDGFEVEFYHEEDAKKFASIYAGSVNLSKTQLFYQGKTEEDMAAAMKSLYENHIYPLKLEMREPTLESLFMEVVGK